jgi:hypothetical protein
MFESLKFDFREQSSLNFSGFNNTKFKTDLLIEQIWNIRITKIYQIDIYGDQTIIFNDQNGIYKY